MTLLRPSRIAFGCSIFSPSRSQRLCCVVSSNASVSLRGHWNFPLSSLLYRSKNPSPSQSSPLMRSHRLCLNNCRKPVYGTPKISVSCNNVCLLIGRKVVQHNSCTNAISVSAGISTGNEICKPFFSIWIPSVCFGTAKGTIAGADATRFSRSFRR